MLATMWEIRTVVDYGTWLAGILNRAAHVCYSSSLVLIFCFFEPSNSK